MVDDSFFHEKNIFDLMLFVQENGQNVFVQS